MVRGFEMTYYILIAVLLGSGKQVSVPTHYDTYEQCAGAMVFVMEQKETKRKFKSVSCIKIKEM